MGSAELLGSGSYQDLQEGESIPEPRSVAIHSKKMILGVLRIPCLLSLALYRHLRLPKC